jgi:hypothetical protein
MKTLSTFEAIKTLLSAGNDVRICNERGVMINIDAALEDALYETAVGAWIISSSKEPLDVREKRDGRVFAVAAYEVDENGRCTGRSMHATMTPVTAADVFYSEMINALEAAELAR